MKMADPELGEEQVRADSWSGRFKSPWLRLVLDKEGCVEASPQPGSVSGSVCVCVCVCVCVSVCLCALVSRPLVNILALRRGLVWVSSILLH